MSSRSSRTLYVGNLPGDVREREVEDLFYKYGPIAHIDLKIPPRPPGYAFVEFEEARDAEDAIRGRDGYDFGGQRLRVELAHGGRGRSSSDRHSSHGGGRGRGPSKRSEYRVLVTGLPSSASWQDLKDHMRRAGDVCFSQVFRDGGGTTGIVDYTNYDDMKYAIKKLDDSEFRNAFSRAYVRVKEYDSKRDSSRSPSRGRSLSKSRSRSRSRGRSKSRSKSPRSKPSRKSPAKSRSRSRSPSASRSRSLSGYGYMQQTGDWILGSCGDMFRIACNSYGCRDLDQDQDLLCLLVEKEGARVPRDAVLAGVQVGVGVGVGARAYPGKLPCGVDAEAVEDPMELNLKQPGKTLIRNVLIVLDFIAKVYYCFEPFYYYFVLNSIAYGVESLKDNIICNENQTISQ